MHDAHPCACVGEVCACQKGMTVSPADGQTCVPILSYVGGDCLFGEQCTPGSVCSNGKCECPVTYANATVNGSVVCVLKMSYVGQPCFDNQTCQLGSACVDGVSCMCPSGERHV